MYFEVYNLTVCVAKANVDAPKHQCLPIDLPNIDNIPASSQDALSTIRFVVSEWCIRHLELHVIPNIGPSAGGARLELGHLFSDEMFATSTGELRVEESLGTRLCA